MADGTLPQLPDDVLQVIYGEVPLRRLLAHRAVCSHFDRVLPMVVQHINLDDRCIGAAGAASLSAALPGCSTLQTLHLVGNGIGEHVPSLLMEPLLPVNIPRVFVITWLISQQRV